MTPRHGSRAQQNDAAICLEPEFHPKTELTCYLRDRQNGV